MNLLAETTTEEAFSLVDRVGEWLLSNGITILVIILVALIVRFVVGALINRVFTTMYQSGSRISRMTNVVVKKNPDAGMAAANEERRKQRADTLATASKNVASVIIWSIAFVMILSQVGVNIAPIIASLGVAGLAAGIGAQTLIKDVLAGVIMLFEDLVAVGDYVDLQFAEGTVENVNLRVTQVRGLNGVLWTVRNGEIISLGNYSRGLGTAFVMLDIASGADDAAVTEAIHTVFDALKADHKWSKLIVGAPEATGILSVDGARYQRRITADTIPGKQWEVEREIRKRLRVEFDKRGVEFALPRFQESA
ncbi:mechanosensitive ion channel family protein [Dermabacter sp. HSID17554]|uniref:mechanosensitive ion channel family protein n=1 Tax=Dermabacter sp. HSID17554 TaxID=2419511 RepID=UPI000F8972ED|nr:mechanosensitive ion channel family protein [Dermabacter sp. HSID17554]RUP86054.1 mechanosensitive ion channel family protein [Dermabacter sp. HSID17554]